MSAHTIPISETSHEALQELAQQTGQPIEAVLERAIEAYHRKVFFDALNAGYAALRADPQAWAEELDERKVWDGALLDGLSPDERWTDDGRAITPGNGEE